VLKTSFSKQHTGIPSHTGVYKIPIHLTADFSVETVEVKREWNNILIVLKGKNHQKTFPTKNTTLRQAILQKCIRQSLTNKSCENLSLSELSYKKYQKWFFNLKERDGNE
jgi:hypothetical protein